METGMHIGQKINEEYARSLAKAIQIVLETSYENRISEKVTIAALGVLSAHFSKSDNIMVSGCTINSDQKDSKED